MSKISTKDDELKQAQLKVDALTKTNAQLQRQVDWFNRELFGRKSEKRIFESPLQATFDGLLGDLPTVPKKEQPQVSIPAHERKKKIHTGTPDDSGLRFNSDLITPKDILLSAPELDGPNASDYEIIRYENTYRLAQRRGSYEVLMYKRPIIRHKEDKVLITPPAPENVFGKSFADVSFVAGMLIDKFCYHLPLYRQHQRLKASHVELSRSTLTNLVEKGSQLLEPIAKAVLESILESSIATMDETPVKAGHSKKKGAKRGQMRQAWYWPISGDKNEIYFHFSSSRGAEVVHKMLTGFNGTLLTDGYAAYENYTQQVESVSHALCWVHSRRNFEKALDDEPVLANQAMDMIGLLYGHEEDIKTKNIEGENKLAYRGENSKPIVDTFFIWCEKLVDKPDLVATESPIIGAIKYMLKREQGLREFLSNPDLPMDTNHIERALRVIPMGRKSWNFCWTELGAHYVGIIQTLLCSCKMQGIDPYVYLVDVLQRVDRHPASQVHELTPRLWKERFADCPLVSDLDKIGTSI